MLKKRVSFRWVGLQLSCTFPKNKQGWNICFFCKNSYFHTGRLQSRVSFNLISVTHNIKGFHVQICQRGSPGAKFNDISHFGPFLRVSIEGWPHFTGPPWKIEHLAFLPNFFWDSLYILESQEKNLGPKVNVKFFIVNKITRSFKDECSSDVHSFIFNRQNI